MPRFATIAAAFPYGFGSVFVAEIEGLPTYFIEREYGATAPTGWTIDASLVIDASARLGSLADREQSGIGKGFPLTLRFLDTSTVRDYFSAPTAVTWLTDDIDEASTSLPVQSTGAFGSSGTLHVGIEAMPYSSTSAQAFAGATRGSYGKAREYDTGEEVSDRPIHWRGRRVRLWLFPVDPFGRIILSGSSLDTSDAALAWEGRIGDLGRPGPIRNGAEWEIVCQPQDQALQMPVGTSATGRAVWSLDADARLLVQNDVTVYIKVRDIVSGYTVLDDVSFRPFDGYGGQLLSAQRIRDLIAAGWDSVRTASELDTITWLAEEAPGSVSTARRWRAYIQARRSASSNGIIVSSYVEGRFSFLVQGEQEESTFRYELPENPTSLWGRARTGLTFTTEVKDATLEVLVERGDPTALPTTGWITLEGDGDKQTLKYQDLEVGEDGVIRLHPADYLVDLTRLAADELAGELKSMTATFGWSLTGTMADAMRTVLQSSGRGDNGTFDTLPLGQGYDLSAVDEASFDTILDGAFVALTIDASVDDRVSFAELFGGLLVLGERAVVPRPSDDGSEINLTCIRTGMPSVLERDDAVTITDADLVYGGSQRPVRVLTSRTPPNKVSATIKGPGGVSQGPINVNNTRRQKYQSLVDWKVDIVGIDRRSLVGPIFTWAQGLFRQSETVQAFELDVVPWLDVVEGDEVSLSLTDVQLWEYSSGTPGYVGPARVVGRQVHPVTKVPTLTVIADGQQTSTRLSPSAPIQDYTGTSTSPTAVKVPRDYYTVFKRYLDERDPDPVYLRIYEPGDDNRYATLEIDDVTDDGTHCVLSVNAITGSIDLDTVLYGEGFESDVGDWLDGGGTYTGTGITRNTGSTPTASTGPTAAYAGSWYMYFESTGMGLGEHQNWLGPAFSLQGAAKATLTFARHIYGSNQGNLAVQISTDGGDSWTTVWGETGDQGNSWELQTVDLASYLGKVCKLRIRCTMPGSGTIGLQDMAWDAITITVIRHRVTNPTSLTAESTTQEAHLHTDTEAIWA